MQDVGASVSVAVIAIGRRGEGGSGAGDERAFANLNGSMARANR